MTKRTDVGVLVLTACLAALPAAAQQLVGSGGHALDSNLRLGSGGYNDAGVGAFEGGRVYASPYETSPRYARNDYYNAFVEQRYNLHTSPYGYGSAGAMPPAGAGGGALRPNAAPGGQAAEQGPLAQAGPTDMPGPLVLAGDQLPLVSYGLGFYLGQKMRKGLELDGVEADTDTVVQGFTDGLLENEPKIAEDELDDMLEAVHDEMVARWVKRHLGEDSEFSRQYEENLVHGREFHDTFAHEPGVITLPNGIQYKVIVPGEGDSPLSTDTVVINIKVTLPDGTEVGSFQNMQVKVGETIEGGRELLPLMKLQAKWQAAIPSQLAFGEAGRPPTIGPNQPILVEVELLGIK